MKIDQPFYIAYQLKFKTANCKLFVLMLVQVYYGYSKWLACYYSEVNVNNDIYVFKES